MEKTNEVEIIDDKKPFSDLRALQFAAEGLMKGTLSRADAAEITNAVGKRIAFYALQLRSIEVKALAEAQGRKVKSIQALEEGTKI